MLIMCADQIFSGDTLGEKLLSETNAQLDEQRRSIAAFVDSTPVFNDSADVDQEDIDPKILNASQAAKLIKEMFNMGFQEGYRLAQTELKKETLELCLSELTKRTKMLEKVPGSMIDVTSFVARSVMENTALRAYLEIPEKTLLTSLSDEVDVPWSHGNAIQLIEKINDLQTCIGRDERPLSTLSATEIFEFFDSFDGSIFDPNDGVFQNKHCALLTMKNEASEERKDDCRALYQSVMAREYIKRISEESALTQIDEVASMKSSFSSGYDLADIGNF